MKYSLALAALSQIGYVAAFPAVAEQIAKSNPEAGLEERQAFPDPNVGFNPKLQHVSVTGANKFIPPNFAAGDVRGPCPGLNAMANHGYLPRSGVGNHLDFILGTEKAFGMAADLSGFLTVLGGSVDGNGLAWSIGGPTKLLPAPLPILGTPQGISGSHNRYESDVSPGRGDLYTHGNDFELQMDQFQQLYDMGIDNGDNIDLTVMNEFRSKRFDDSVAKNPYLFLGPFTGVLVAPAAFEFIYRFMGNKSAEYPQGKLDTKILMDFFGVHKDKSGKLVKTGGGGYERFPDNWYKRAVGDEYTIPLLNFDTVLAASKYPKFLSVGGNVGKPNSFIGLDIANITGGVMNTQDLLKGNNLACFAMNFAVQAAPDLIKCSGVLSNIEGVGSKLNTQLAKSTAGLQCPALAKPSMSQFSQFPGYSKLKCQTGKY